MPRFAVPDSAASAHNGICSWPDCVPFGRTWPGLTCSQASSTNAGERLTGSILHSNDAPADLPTSDVRTYKTRAHELLTHSCIQDSPVGELSLQFCVHPSRCVPFEESRPNGVHQ